MGLDVGAYKAWNKNTLIYKKPKLNKKVRFSDSSLNDFRIEFFKKTNEDFDDFIFSYVGSNKESDFYQEDLNRYKKYSQHLLTLIETHFQDEEIKKYKELINELKNNYAILITFDNKSFCLYSFNELEEYKRDIWEYEEYVESKFPNGEILDAFSKVRELYNINLYPFIINAEQVENIQDKDVNHNTNKAIQLVSEVLELDKENTILYNRTKHYFDDKQGKMVSEPSNPLYLREVLEECVRLWSVGAKLEYS